MAVVGPLGLLPEEHDPTVEAIGALGLGRRGPGQAGTYDHERAVRGSPVMNPSRFGANDESSTGSVTGRPVALGVRSHR